MRSTWTCACPTNSDLPLENRSWNCSVNVLGHSLNMRINFCSEPIKKWVGRKDDISVCGDFVKGKAAPENITLPYRGGKDCGWPQTKLHRITSSVALPGGKKTEMENGWTLTKLHRITSSSSGREKDRDGLWLTFNKSAPDNTMSAGTISGSGRDLEGTRWQKYTV